MGYDDLPSGLTIDGKGPSDLQILLESGKIGPFYLGQRLQEARAIISAFDPEERSWELSGISDDECHIGMFTFPELEIIVEGPSEETSVITSFSYRPGYPYAQDPPIDYPWQHTSDGLCDGTDLKQAMELFAALGEPTPVVGWIGDDRDPLWFNVGTRGRFWFKRVAESETFGMGDKYEFGEVEVSDSRGAFLCEFECTRLWYMERQVSVP